MSRPSILQLVALITYTLVSLWVIFCYHYGLHSLGFYCALALIVVGVMITISSTRRYRQRLNYVEGLEKASHDRDLNGEDSQTALQSHWVDSLGDRGVGFINMLMILVAVPGLLGHASLIPQLSLFAAPSMESHGFGFETWVAFVAIESVGFMGLVFDYFGLDQLSQVADLGDLFSEHWRWFMAAVQVGLLSLAFDIFRRYLDLSAALDRFIQTLSLSGDELKESAAALQSSLRLGEDRDQHRERELLNLYRRDESEAHARVETLARFLMVFPKRRIIKRVVQFIDIKTSRVDTTLGEESQSLLLTALSLAGMRSQIGLITRVNHNVAFRLLSERSNLHLRIAALDTLSGYYAIHQDELPRLSVNEQERMMGLANEQFRVGSAHAISTELSVTYERLCLAASYALASSQQLESALPLLILRYSEAKLLTEESERRLDRLLTHCSIADREIMERVTEVIDAAHREDDLGIEESLDLFSDSVKRLNASHLAAGIEAEPIRESLLQLIMINVLGRANGPGVIRQMVGVLSIIGEERLAQILWSALSAPPQKNKNSRVIAGLIEGVRAHSGLYQRIQALLVDQLCHGQAHDVQRAAQLCFDMSLDDLSPLPSALLLEITHRYHRLAESETVSIQDEEREALITEISHLTCGLSNVRGTPRIRGEVMEVLNELEEGSETSKHLRYNADLLRSMTGDESAFLTLFSAYRGALAYRLAADQFTEGRGEEGNRDETSIISIMRLLDPSLYHSALQWEQTLQRATINDNEPALDNTQIKEISRRLVEEMLPQPSAVKISWFMAFMNGGVTDRLRSQTLQLMRSRLKYLEHTSIDPLTNLAPLEWLFDEAMKRLKGESNASVKKQWLRLIASLALKVRDEERVGRGVALLKRCLKGEESRVNAELRGLSAELLGELGRQYKRLDISLFLVTFYDSLDGALPVAVSRGVARALGGLNDHHAVHFFTIRAEEPMLRLRREALTAMVKCLGEHRAYQPLITVIGQLRDLSDSELGALCRPLVEHSVEIKALLEKNTRHLIRNYALQRVSDDQVSPAALEACIGLIPLAVDEDDLEAKSRLFDLLLETERQGQFYRISKCIAATFPLDYQSRYNEILERLDDDLRPKWMMGLGEISSQRVLDDFNPREFMLAELIKWFNERDSELSINPENVLELSTKLLQYGGNEERVYVYEWMRLKHYQMISYAIVWRVIEYGQRPLDVAPLKDELNRLRSHRRRLERSSSVIGRWDIGHQARYEVELLDALRHFGDTKSKVKLMELSVIEPQSDYERVVQRWAITKLSDEQRVYLEIDMDIESAE